MAMEQRTRRGRAICIAVGLALSVAAVAHAQSPRPAPPQPAEPALAKPSAAPATPQPAAAATSSAVAKPAEKPARTSKPPKFDAAASEARLAQPETLAAGLAEVEAAGASAKKLAPRIDELVQKGLPPELAVAAIRALGALGAPASSAVIAPYVQHRNAEVRRASAQALARTKGLEASAALRRGLRSGDATVRALSASGLRFAGDAESVPDLIRALERGVDEAAASLGALCSDAQCDAVLARFDKLAADVKKATFEAMLGRKPALPDELLLRAVETLRISEGAAAKGYFQSLKAALKAGPKVSGKVQKALDAAAPAPGGAKP